MFAKKLLALLLALVLTLGLAACGGSTTTTPDILGGDTTTPDPPSTGDPVTPDAPATGDTTEEPETVVEPWDGDYETATFADVRKYGIGSTNWDGSLPLTTTGESLEIGVRAQTKVTDWDNNPLTHWLEEKTGSEIDYEIYSEYGFVYIFHFYEY